jgi:hypothetical protein
MIITSKKSLNSQIWKAECSDETLLGSYRLGTPGICPQGHPTVMAVRSPSVSQVKPLRLQPTVLQLRNATSPCVCKNTEMAGIARNIPLVHRSPAGTHKRHSVQRRTWLISTGRWSGTITRSRVTGTWAEILTFPLPSYVTWGKLVNHSKLQFPTCKIGALWVFTYVIG